MNSEISEKILKSHTSIVGIVCKDGIVLAGDRRATAGSLILNKDEKKLRRINDYLVIAITGGVADALISEKVLAAELRLLELRNKARPTVREAAHMVGMMLYRNIRTPTMIPFIVGMLVGGFNEDGSTELYSIEPAGSIYKVKDYDANFSSGMPYILGLLERTYKKEITTKEAIELGKECIKASSQRDAGSGNGIDVMAITKEGISHPVSEEAIIQYK